MAECEEQVKTTIPRANPEVLKAVFDKYASIDKDGKKYMTDSDFIRR